MGTTTSCNCPTPPGGRVECEPDQAAVCWVDADGNLLARCFSVPEDVRSASVKSGVGSSALVHWLADSLAEATGLSLETLQRRIGHTGLRDMSIDRISETTLHLQFLSPNRRRVELNVRLPEFIENERSAPLGA